MTSTLQKLPFVLVALLTTLIGLPILGGALSASAASNSSKSPIVVALDTTDNQLGSSTPQGGNGVVAWAKQVNRSGGLAAERFR